MVPLALGQERREEPTGPAGSLSAPQDRSVPVLLSWCSSGTLGGRCGAARRPGTIPGKATAWSGRPPPRRPTTTSMRCPTSAPSGPCSTPATAPSVPGIDRGARGERIARGRGVAVLVRLAMAQHSYATCQKRDCHGAQKTHAESPVESYTAFEQQRPLHVRDRLRHLDPARAAVRAVEHRPAAPAVTRVEDEAVRRDNRLRPDVPLVAHEHRSPTISTGTLARAASLVATLPSRTLDIPAPLAPTTSKP